MAVCPKCNGKKFIEKHYGIVQEICPDCKGTGIVNEQRVDNPDRRNTEHTGIGTPVTVQPRQPQTRNSVKK